MSIWSYHEDINIGTHWISSGASHQSSGRFTLGWGHAGQSTVHSPSWVHMAPVGLWSRPARLSILGLCHSWIMHKNSLYQSQEIRKGLAHRCLMNNLFDLQEPPLCLCYLFFEADYHETRIQMLLTQMTQVEKILKHWKLPHEQDNLQVIQQPGLGLKQSKCVKNCNCVIILQGK